MKGAISQLSWESWDWKKKARYQLDSKWKMINHGDKYNYEFLLKTTTRPPSCYFLILFIIIHSFFKR